MVKKSYVALMSKAITHPLYREFTQLLEDYLAMSRKRQSSPICLYKLQQWILSDLLYHGRVMDDLKGRKAELDGALKSATEPKKKMELGEQLREAKLQELIFRLMQRHLTEIVDGMVWRLFNFNRAALNVVACTKQKGRLQLTKGLEAELSELVDHCYNGRIALLNDLSSLIDVGDVTVKSSDGSFEFYEIKTSMQGSERAERQKQKHERAVRFLNDGCYEENGRLHRLVDVDIAPDNYLARVLHIVKEAKRNGHCAYVLSKYLIVECDYVDLLTDPADIERVKEKRKRITNCWDPRDRVLTFSNTFRLRHYPRVYAPYSVFPYPADICVDLITGRAMLFGLINMSRIIEILRASNWDVREEVAPDSFFGGPKSFHVLTLHRGRFHTTVTGSDLVRMGYEFMKLNTLLRKYEAVYEKSSQDKKTETWLPNILREKEVWR